MNSITRIALVIALGTALLAGSAGTALAAAQAVSPPSTNTSPIGPGPDAGGVLDPGTRTYRSALYENGTQGIGKVLDDHDEFEWSGGVAGVMT